MKINMRALGLRYLERIPVRLRLSLAYAVWMAIAFSAVGSGVYRLAERQLLDSVDGALIASAESLRSARTSLVYRSSFTESFLRSFFGEEYVRPYAQLVDLSGRVSEKTQNVRVSLPVTPQAVKRAEQGLATLETIERKNLPPLRQITLPIIRDNKFTGELIQVGAPMDPTFNALRGISTMLWLFMPLALIMTIVFGYLMTGWSLRPVSLVTGAASKMGSEDLSLRLPLPPARDEIRALAKTFNSMLDRLQDAFSRMRRFTGDVSHELRTPLTVLRGEAELALRKDRSVGEYQAALRKIAQESIHMTEIVEDLLLLARAQSKSLALDWETVRLDDFMKKVSQSVESTFQLRSVKLTTDYPKTQTFDCVPGYLNLALKNILINAAKHSDANGVVEFNAGIIQENIQFSIRDHGEGIPAEALPYIFDPFYRVDSARNRDRGGAGIGLCLAQALTDLHSGKLHVESEFKKGAVFFLTIPLQKRS